MKHGITSFDMREESIAQALHFRGSFNETRNINHIKECGHFAAK